MAALAVQGVSARSFVCGGNLREALPRPDQHVEQQHGILLQEALAQGIQAPTVTSVLCQKPAVSSGTAQDSLPSVLVSVPGISVREAPVATINPRANCGLRNSSGLATLVLLVLVG